MRHASKKRKAQQQQQQTNKQAQAQYLCVFFFLLKNQCVAFPNGFGVPRHRTKKYGNKKKITWQWNRPISFKPLLLLSAVSPHVRQMVENSYIKKELRPSFPPVSPPPPTLALRSTFDFKCFFYTSFASSCRYGLLVYLFKRKYLPSFPLVLFFAPVNFGGPLWYNWTEIYTYMILHESGCCCAFSFERDDNDKNFGEQRLVSVAKIQLKWKQSLRAR